MYQNQGNTARGYCLDRRVAERRKDVLDCHAVAVRLCGCPLGKTLEKSVEVVEEQQQLLK